MIGALQPVVAGRPERTPEKGLRGILYTGLVGATSNKI
jgi:hypothetical protein